MYMYIYIGVYIYIYIHAGLIGCWYWLLVEDEGMDFYRTPYMNSKGMVIFCPYYGCAYIYTHTCIDIHIYVVIYIYIYS